MPPIKKRAGPNKHRLHLKHEDLQRVVNFINNYRIMQQYYQDATQDTGSLVESCCHVTNAVVWRLYKESMTTLGM